MDTVCPKVLVPNINNWLNFSKVTVVPEDVEVVDVGPRHFTVRWRCDEVANLREIYTYMVCTRKVNGNEECVERCGLVDI